MSQRKKKEAAVPTGVSRLQRTVRDPGGSSGAVRRWGGVGLLQGRQSEEQDYRTVAWISGLVPAPGLYIL